MFLYVVMAGWSAAALGFNTRLSAMMAQAIAPTGAVMTFIALWTGAFWGRPTWGTYWAWDARMTSELILLFLYLGVIALRNAIDDPRRADPRMRRAATGVVNVPIITSPSIGGIRCIRVVGQPHEGARDGGDHADGHADHVRCGVATPSPFRSPACASSCRTRAAPASVRRGLGNNAPAGGSQAAK
jgi:hypothetical protein